MQTNINRVKMATTKSIAKAKNLVKISDRAIARLKDQARKAQRRAMKSDRLDRAFRYSERDIS